METHTKLFVLFSLVAIPLLAADIHMVARLESQTGSVGPVGLHLPFNTQPAETCPINTLVSGIRVDHQSTGATGLSFICRFYRQIGATDTTDSFDTPRVGRSSASRTRIECPSGRAATGFRVRTSLFLVTAITIECGTVNPQFSQNISYSNDTNFGNGVGALVTRGTPTSQGSPVGGGGGPETLQCPSDRPFLVGARASVSSDKIDGLLAFCGRILTKSVDLAAQQADLAVRTIGQQRTATVTNDRDLFTVELFNLGAAVSDNGGNLYFDLIFSPDDVTFTMIHPSCSTVSSGRIRCSLTRLEARSRTAPQFEINPRRTHPDTPLFVVQASYDINDSNLSNNTYGFATQVVN